MKRLIGWLLVIGTVGVASCQAFLASDAEVRGRVPPQLTQEQ